MNQTDFDQFCAVWGAASEIYNVTPTDAAMMLSFKALSKYSINEVVQGVEEHISNSQFPPKPADIIAIIGTNDGRPEPDEAWAIAMQSFDEYKTVIVNDEIMGSLNQARSIYSDGDKVGARMAFKASYEKAIAKGRRNGEVVHWWPSIGHDVESRQSAIEQAVISGLLTETHANQFLLAPITAESRKLINRAKSEAMKSLAGK